jgi:hypothetical protein
MAMKRPLSLTIAVVLQWAAAVVGIISGFDLIAAAFEMSKEGVAQQIEGALVSQGVVDVTGGFVVVGVFVAGVVLLAIAFLRVMVALYLARGHRWARTVVTVLVGLSLVTGTSYLFQGFVLRFALTVVVDVVVLWLMFNASSSEFIRSRTSEELPARS